MSINSFYFQGVIGSTPETKSFGTNSKTSFFVEQHNNYKGVEKTIVVSIGHWHKGDSHTQYLKPGDPVLVSGKFSSNPYKDKHILNLDATSVVALPKETVAIEGAPESPLPF